MLLRVRIGRFGHVISRVVAYAASYLPTYLLPHVVTAYLGVHHLNEAQAGVLAMLESGALATANLLAASLSAPLRRRLLLAGCAWVVVANWLCIDPLPFQVLAVLRASNGLVFGLGAFVASQSLALGAAPERDFGWANGTLALVGGGLLWLVPSLPGNSSAEVFLTLIGVALLLGLATMSLGSSASNPVGPVERAGTGGPGGLLRNTRFLALLVVAALLFGSLGGLYDFAAYQGSRLGMSNSTVGAILGGTTVAGLAGGPAAGWLCTRVGLALPALASVILAAVTCVAIGEAFTQASFAIAFALCGITYMFALTTVASIGVSIDASGRAAAIVVGWQTLSVALGALLVGMLLAKHLDRACWMIGAGLCLVAGLPAAWSIGRIKKGPTVHFCA